MNETLRVTVDSLSLQNYGKLVDLVILSSPSNPPYSLQCMISDLKQKAKFTVRTATHCHSSVTEPLSANLLDFFPDDEGQEVADPNMKVTIIWKKSKLIIFDNDFRQVFSIFVVCLSVSCDPRLTVKSRQISGEGNIARYLARLFPEIFTYENLKNDAAGSATQTDDWLDAAHAAFLYGDAAKEEAFLQRMKIALTNRKVLVGPGVCPSIADYVVWSLIKGRRDDSRLEPVLQPWAKSCRESATGRKYDDSRVGPNASSPSRGKKHENSRKSSSTVDKSGSSTKQVSASRVEDKKTRILSLLSSIGVNEVDVVEHPPVTTVESMMTHLNEVDGAVTKNFFLRDKGKSLFLMTAKHNHQVDLGAIGKQLGIKDLRFGPEELMEQKLGVKKGCLSLLALANDREKQEVKLLMDESLLEGSFARVYMHPLVNDCSVGISKEGLSKFLEHISHPPVLLKFT